MSTSHWSRVRALLERALELEPEPEARAAYLDRACAGDRNLRGEIEDLLALELASLAFEPAPAARFEAVLEAAVPERIGPYRIERLIGSGGMGEVYLARREGPGFEQPVALKLVKLGMDTRALLARFHRERALLAGLQHEGIARLLDAGATEGGRPFLVMEYVDGRPIDGWCDERELGVRERVALACEVCAAVQHAHQHLVLHRDIKPDNILVTSAGRPKLLDFGLAKLLPGAEDGEGERTLTGERLLTPAYASPEQLRGEAVGVASDVYSLGVVLYQLLTGERPFGAERWTSVAHAFEAPIKPSARVRASRGAGRGSDRTTRHHASQLAGDLDTIVLKALEPETERRYPSVEALARDLQRHLDGLPVEARPATWRYRAAKFVQRHRAGIAAAAAVLAALIATGWWSLVSYRNVVAAHGQAEEQRGLAEARRARVEAREGTLRKIAIELMLGVHDSLASLKGAIGVRERVLDLSLGALDAATADAELAPTDLVDAASALVRLARVQGLVSAPSRGDTRLASESLCRAQELLERAVRGDPAGLAAHALLSRVHTERALLARFAGDLTSAAAEDELALSEGVAGSSAADPLEWIRLLQDYATSRGEVALEARTLEEATFLLERGAALAEELCAFDPSRDSYGRWVRALDDLAGLARLRGDERAASAHVEISLEILRFLTAREPDNAQLACNFAITLNHASEVACAQGRTSEAEALAREEVALCERLASLDPLDERVASARANAHVQLGLCFFFGAKDEEAAQEIEQGIALHARMSESYPENLPYGRDLALAEQYLGSVRIYQGRLDEGCRLYDRAIERVEAAGRKARDARPWIQDRIGFRINEMMALEQNAISSDGVVRDARALDACERVCRSVLEDIERQGGEAELVPSLRQVIAPMRATLERCIAAKASAVEH